MEFFWYYYLLTGLKECLNPIESNLYLETPVFLIHMSNEVLEKFKEYIQLVCKVKWIDRVISFVEQSLLILVLLGTSI